MRIPYNDFTMNKFTKIVATISDKRCDTQFIASLAAAGLNVVRMNSAHLELEGFRKITDNVREAAPDIAIMMDTKGPEVRTTATSDGNPLNLKTGAKVVVKGDPETLSDCETVCLNYPGICNDVKEGDRMLIDDGEIALTVEENDGFVLKCVVENDGTLGSRKSVNIPGTSLSLPALTERDKRNIGYAVDLDVDFIAHSFVRSAQDVEAVKSILESRGSNIKVISKIENQEGVDNFDSILEASYGIMIARGDLGIEVPAEKIPGIQMMMVAKCIEAHKPVIVATQMLHSMIEHPRPTRAEVSDVAAAVSQRADAVMLSGETAYGKYPVEAVEIMAKISREVEKSLSSHQDVPPMHDHEVSSFLSRQAVLSESYVGTRAILTDSFHGLAARFISSFRGKTPTIAICYNRAVQRWLALSYGVDGHYYESGCESDRNRFHPVEAMKRLLAEGVITADERVAYLSGTEAGVDSLEINTIENMIREN